MRRARPTASRRPKPRARSESPGFSAGGFYRLARMLHAYLSAFAFLALIFFSVTGLTLNHPDWLAGRRPPERTRTIQVPAADLAAAMKTEDPERALAALVGRLTPLVGRFGSGEIVDGDALLRLEGPAGTSDVTLNTRTGEAEVTTQAATTVGLLNDLHKGKAAGKAWGLLIDVSAVLLIAMSAIGYVLFFSLRFRLVPSLVLTGVSLAVLLGTFWLFVG